MRFRTGVLVGLAVGYVFGTRAGRARYLQIKDRWDGFAESPMPSFKDTLTAQEIADVVSYLMSLKATR